MSYNISVVKNVMILGAGVKWPRNSEIELVCRSLKDNRDCHDTKHSPSCACMSVVSSSMNSKGYRFLYLFFSAKDSSV